MLFRSVLNSVETVRMVKAGFHVLGRASDDLELPQSGLGMAHGMPASRRELLEPAVQATLDAIRVIVNQKDKTLPVLMKQLALTQDEASFVYDAIRPGWALDGRPTPGAVKLDAELSQRDLGLKELPRVEQTYDFSMLDELGKK